MKDQIYVDGAVPQWKGNLHLHTTLSDGESTPEQVVALHREQGYAFCLISDHHKYWNDNSLSTPDFIVLSGTESAVKYNPNGKWRISDREGSLSLHLHAILDESEPRSDRQYHHGEEMRRGRDCGCDSWQAHIDHLRTSGHLVILNHPRWSRIEPADLLSLHGYFALEVWNTASEILECSGESEYEWDFCLQKGRRVYAVAADDVHVYSPAARQFGGGFTMVSAAALSGDALCRALKNGHFYASCGPQIRDMRVEQGILRLICSGAKAVRLISRNGYAPMFFPQHGAAELTEISWKIPEELIYVRPEIIGQTGEKAWGPPVFMDDLAE